ncbi:profilin I [Pelomyxa schiedti]|nr:profilin I [Pelomyxa schiedti]
MSWQTYVDTNLVGSGFVDSAAILDATNGAVWAKSATFPDVVANKEAAKLVQNFTDPSVPQSSGILCGKLKYMCVKADPRSVYGKGNKGGVVTVKTGKCILVGIYVEPKQPGNATKVVEDMADYLLGVGY